MLCKQCGSIMPDDAVVCPNCGAAAVNDAPSSVGLGKGVNFDYMGKKVFRADSAERYNIFFQKKFATQLITGVVAAVVVVVAAVNVVSFIGRSDLTQFVKVEEHGYQGKGSVSYTIDKEKILNQVFGAESEYDLSSEDQETFYTLVYDLDNSITTESVTTDLSNGDKVVYKIEDVKQIAEDTGLKFKSKDKVEYTLETLSAPAQLKVSDLFDVSFMGYDGAGSVKLTLKKSSKFTNVSITGNDTVVVEGAYITVAASDLHNPTLKNGNTVKLMLTSSANNDDLRERYGFFLDSSQTESFNVKGLTTSEEIDVFSHLDISISGVDGDAKVDCKWDSSVVGATVTSDSKPTLSVYSDTSKGFSVYGAKSGSSSPLIFITDGEMTSSSYGDDYDSFSIEASKTSNITGGDSIVFKIVSNGSEVSEDSYSDHGYTFKETSYTYEVESGSLDRYLTSKNQLTKDTVRDYGEVVKDEAEQYLKDNWAYVVHGSSSFHCYDQKINSTSIESRIFMAKTSSYSNTYDIWYVYIFKVTDSETSKEKTVSILATVSSPLINSSDSSISTNNSIAFKGYDSPADAISSLDYYKKYDDYGFTEFSFV